MRQMDFYRTRGSKEHIGHRVEDLWVQGLGENLAVVHHRRDGCRGRDGGNPIEHAPFDIKEPMSLAEPDPLLVDGARARNHVVDLPDAIAQPRQRDVLAHPFQAVEGRGVQHFILGNSRGIEQPKPAFDRVRRHQDALPVEQGTVPQLFDAVVRRNEYEGGVAIKTVTHQGVVRAIATLEVRNEFPEVVVKPAVRNRDLAQLGKDALTYRRFMVRMGLHGDGTPMTLLAWTHGSCTLANREVHYHRPWSIHGFNRYGSDAFNARSQQRRHNRGAPPITRYGGDAFQMQEARIRA